MVVHGKCKVFLFLIFVLSRVSEICAQSAKSLYVARPKENTNIHIFERSETQNSVPDSTGVWKHDSTGHSLYKRSAAVESNITTNVRFHFCHACCGLCKYAVHYFAYVRVLCCAVLRIYFLQIYFALKCC
jgi:hypothetical protein